MTTKIIRINEAQDYLPLWFRHQSLARYGLDIDIDRMILLYDARSHYRGPVVADAAARRPAFVRKIDCDEEIDPGTERVAGIPFAAAVVRLDSDPL